MVRTITRPLAAQMIAELAYRMGHEVHAERATMLADDLAGYAEPAWTVDEFTRACRVIRMDAQVAKEVTFDRTLTARIFALARERWEVRAGRPFEFDEACDACEQKAGLTFGELFDVARTEDAGQVFILRRDGAARLDKKARDEAKEDA